MSMSELLAVAAGGVIGAVARYLVYVAVGHLLGTGFPYATLIVNIVGSFAMGVLVELMALVWSTSIEMRLFLTTGILGAFTTFSAFSLDLWRPARDPVRDRMAVQVVDQPTEPGARFHPSEKPDQLPVIEMMSEQGADHGVEAQRRRQLEDIGSEVADGCGRRCPGRDRGRKRIEIDPHQIESYAARLAPDGDATQHVAVA